MNLFISENVDATKFASPKLNVIPILKIVVTMANASKIGAVGIAIAQIHLKNAPLIVNVSLIIMIVVHMEIA